MHTIYCKWNSSLIAKKTDVYEFGIQCLPPVIILINKIMIVGYCLDTLMAMLTIDRMTNIIVNVNKIVRYTCSTVISYKFLLHECL